MLQQFARIMALTEMVRNAYTDIELYKVEGIPLELNIGTGFFAAPVDQAALDVLRELLRVENIDEAEIAELVEFICEQNQLEDNIPEGSMNQLGFLAEMLGIFALQDPATANRYQFLCKMADRHNSR